LTYKISNGVVSIAGDMPVLEEGNPLKESMMRFCLEDNCNKTVIFSPNREMPKWSGLATDIINLFYEDNITNGIFSVNKSGDIRIGGELLTRSSKDKIAKIIARSGVENVLNSTHLKISQKPKEKRVVTNIEEEDSPVIGNIIENNITTPPPPKSKIETVQEKVSKLLRDKRINFYRGRAGITPKGKETLNEILEALKELPDLENIEIEVRGYTDASGKRATNRWISEARAKSVKIYLGSHGIPSENIVAKGFGEDNLLYEEEPYNPLNRRVEIEIKRR
jgi:outer membrane protein OmpA-like peptidoglycan-associated protein